MGLDFKKFVILRFGAFAGPKDLNVRFNPD
jgi:hypothetical protein